MYEMSQNLIEESYEKSLKLSDIPGLLTVNKVKPKEDGDKKKLRVTNVHGSMEAQDVLNKVASLENDKQEKKRCQGKCVASCQQEGGRNGTKLRPVPIFTQGLLFIYLFIYLFFYLFYFDDFFSFLK